MQSGGSLAGDRDWLPWALAGSAGLLFAAGAARLVVAADRREAERAWRALVGGRDEAPAAFHPSMVAGLPEAAQLYFRFAIAPGTPLRRVAVIEMDGKMGLGDRDHHRFYPMTARQVLAPPHGFVWTPELGAGLIRMSGSDGLLDGHGWTRFWLLGTVPIVRTAGTGDVARSAAGRLIGESLWTPAALLPQRGVRWQGIDRSKARFTIEIAGETHAAEITVGKDGRPLEIFLRRWSNANPQKVFRDQPFGATFDRWELFEGFRVPTRVSGGNHFGSADYFPFFQASVTGIAYR